MKDLDIMSVPLSLYKQIEQNGSLEMLFEDYIRLHGWCKRNGAKIKSHKHGEKAGVRIVKLIQHASYPKRVSRQDAAAMIAKINELKREVEYWRGLANGEEQ